MKNTSIPLDIIFVNENGVVISVKQGTPESEDLITESSEFVAYVIELNAGSGVKPGDQTSLGETIEETDPDEDESAEDEYPDLQVNKLRKAKRAYKTQSDADYKALGRYIFNEMKAQDNRPAEYTE